MRRVRGVLVWIGCFLFTGVLAAVDEVRLQVKGLACPFCTYGIEKNLNKLPGVTSVETTIRTGIVRVRLGPGVALDLEGLRQAVARSGFTLDHVAATVTGRLTSHDGRPALQAEPGGQSFLLLEAGREEMFEELSETTRDRLSQVSAGGSRQLTVTGRVHGHVGMPPGLSVEAFEVAR
jgi:mercuric ion binding protein